MDDKEVQKKVIAELPHLCTAPISAVCQWRHRDLHPLILVVLEAIEQVQLHCGQAKQQLEEGGEEREGGVAMQVIVKGIWYLLAIRKGGFVRSLPSL